MTINDIKKLTLEQRWEFIKYQLRMRGTSITQLARDIGVDERTVRWAKLNRYPRIERSIAKALNVQPWEIWPERWNNDYTPVRERPNTAECKYTRSNSNSTVIASHRLSCGGV
ncbi:helix-turn-helix domain-containing protein [Pseudomonas sp. F1_0610]|uniref:helix-turn-helix domain-containing protein n=1 Tax=Pseudomonas sp. F1_0610 TaxID=3114284 RepID=UPI0039C28684